MEKSVQPKPYFRIEAPDRNRVQHYFDYIEYSFYYHLPSYFGVRLKKPAFVQHNNGEEWVFLNYRIADLFPRAFENIVNGRYLDFISSAWVNQSKLYSIIFFCDDVPSPDALLGAVASYYFPQQALRVVFAPVAERTLLRHGLDPSKVGFERPPELDFSAPAYRGLSQFGYGSRSKDVSLRNELLEEAAGRGVDYLRVLLPFIQVLVWAQYFAQTEDAYVFGVLSKLRDYYPGFLPDFSRPIEKPKIGRWCDV